MTIYNHLYFEFDPGTPYISSLEDTLTSAIPSGSGVCVPCESVKQEEGFLTCTNYGEE